MGLHKFIRNTKKQVFLLYIRASQPPSGVAVIAVSLERPELP